MILEILKQLNSTRVIKVFLLFPTIEKMALTPNGQSVMKYLWSSLRNPFTGLIWLSTRLIPESVKKCVLSMHFNSTPREHLEPIMQGVMNIDEKSIYNILRMAGQEMRVVVDPPLDVIDDNINKIVFYYGVGDKWNVEDCYRNMAARYSGKEVNLCQRNIPHAFVECSSDFMADYVHSKL